MRVRDAIISLMYFPEDMEIVVRSNAGKPGDEDEFFLSSVSKVHEDISGEPHKEHNVVVLEYNVL